MTIDRQQIVVRLSTLTIADGEPEEQDEPLDYIVSMIIVQVRDLGSLIKYILEIIDPAYGTGRHLPPPYDEELRNFCSSLKADSYLEAYEAIPKIRAYVEALMEGKAPEALNVLTAADADTFIALTQAAVAVFFYAIKIGAMPGTRPEAIPTDAVVTPFFLAVKRLLWAHRKESGQGAMESVLSYIADRLVAVLSETQQ